MDRTPLLVRGLVACALPFLMLESAWAQPADADPKFGMEFEFAGAGNRVVRFEEMPFENYERIMRGIVEHFGGDPSTIRRVDFTKPTVNLEKYPTGERPLFKAEWVDPKGRKWMIEPEFVASTGFDGYELVTPVLSDPTELRGVLDKIQATGAVRTGRRSGVHLTVDASKLIGPNGDARALSNLILMHENAEPMLRRIFNPVRGGGHANYFARSIAVDHEDVLKEIDALPPEERTKERLESIFKAREGREMAIHEIDPMDPNSMNKMWKYRSMNLAKALALNPMHSSPVPLVEFRMFDLADPATHELQSKLYRRMFTKAAEMAANGESVTYKPRAPMPVGEDPGVYNTPENPAEAKAEAREFIESLGLDPVEFQPLLDKTITARELRTPSEFKGMLDALPDGVIEHNGKAMTYGFELEGRGDGLVNIARPSDAEVNARWDTMSDAEKRAYYREVVGENHRSVKNHFNLDTEKHKWLNDYWYVEGSGNWEIHSNVHENLKEATDAMRTAKTLTGESGKGFHLHMRDNAPDWDKLEANGPKYADFVERASNWVYLKRVERLRTDLSLKSWSNARMSPSELADVAELRTTDRATLRVAGVDRNADGTGYIDMEIRGFTKSVDDIETLGKIFAHQFKNHEWGNWGVAENPHPSENWGEAPEELRYRDHFERYMAEVEGKVPSATKLEIIEGLQGEWAERAGGDTRAYGTGVATPLLNWEHEKSLPESARREAKFAKEEFLGWLNRYADRIQGGEFGVDLRYANEQALTEKLGLSPEAAKAIVAAREGRGGEVEVEEALREVALRAGASPEDLPKLERLGSLDVDRASKVELIDRLGLSEAEAKKLVDYRTAHSLEESLRFARVGADRRATLEGRAEGLDIGSSEVSAEKIAEHAGIDIETARRIVAYRDAHSVATEADWKSAGLDAAELDEVRGLPTGPGIDLATATEAELRAAGLTANQAKTLIEARSANPLTRFSDLTEKVGLSEAALNKLRASGTLAEVNGLSVEELMERGLTRNQAEKLVTYRDPVALESEARLGELLGNAGRRLYTRAVGVDLAKATANELVNAGLSSEAARKLLKYRDAKLIGRAVPGGAYSSTEAAETLYYDDVIDYSENDKIEERTERVDLTKASAETLERLGLTENQARKLAMYRDPKSIVEEGISSALEDAGLSEARAAKAEALAEAMALESASVEEIMERTGLSNAKAKKLKALASIDVESATLEELRAAGLSEAQAKDLIEAREKLAGLEGINYKDAVRNLRLKVRKWVRDSNISEHLLRSLLPKTEVSVVTTAESNGEGFGRTRGATGPFEPSKMSLETVGGVFGSVKEAALLRLAARLQGAENAGVADNIRESIERVGGLGLEVLESNEIRAEIAEGKVRVSTGLLNQIHARAEALPPGQRPFFRARVLGLIFSHEAAHGTGFSSEKMADAEGLKILEGANGLGTIEGERISITQEEIRGALESFDKPLGSSHIDNFLNRLRGLFRYGRPSERRENLERAAEGEVVDKLAKYRRADGTVKWSEFSRDTAGREALGLAHFGMALFLKELAVVTATGDRARIEEFFDGLMTTDFYKEYGLFIAGARIGEVGYSRYLQRYVKPKFVNGILKSNLVLATGLALPMIVNGTFEGKAFAITLGSLGVSSAAVQGASRSIKWLIDLRKAKTAGTAARTGLALGRLAKAGAWFYTAAELAVVLYVAEDLEHMVNGYIDRAAAKDAVADAGERFFAAVNDADATPESIRAASEDYDKAFTDYRNFLYQPLYEDEAVYAGRIEKAAREAKILADRNQATIDRVKQHDALRRNIEGRYGSIEAYAEHLSAEADKELQEKMDTFSASYNKSREAHLEEVYRGSSRSGSYLDGLADRDWLLSGAEAGAAGDPYASSSVPLYGNLARSRARGSLRDALEDLSANRLESYDDEAEALKAARALLVKQGRQDLVRELDSALVANARIREADDRLSRGEGVLDTSTLTPADGIAERLRESGAR